MGNHGRSSRRQILSTSLAAGAALFLSPRLLHGSFPLVNASSATDAFDRTWARTDQPVAASRVSRTWIWGPTSLTQLTEDGRLVRYYDKARMEDNTSNAQPPWDVTTGLLAKELMTGQLQTGPASFEGRTAAQINVAGDANDPTGPTYATFNKLMGYGAIPSGWKITQTVDRAGNVGNDSSLTSNNVTAQDVGAPTMHTVASVFWDFMTSSGSVFDNGSYTNANLFPNPFYATGYPLTEAYWSNILVGGAQKQVLVQVFERRVLTYTPSNPAGWEVEAGNVGQHYFTWRYGHAPQSQSGATPENPNGDFVVVAGNGWAFLTAKKDVHGAPPIQIIPDPSNPDAMSNLNKVADMISSADPSLTGRTITLVLLQSPEQIREFGLDPNAKATVDPTLGPIGFNTETLQDKNNILNQQQIGLTWGITGGLSQGPAYEFLRSDVLSDPSVLGKVSATADDLKAYLIGRAGVHMLGQGILDSGTTDLVSADAISQYVADNTKIIPNPN